LPLLGALEEFQLAHIIALLQVEKQTGELALERPGEQVSLFFRDGAIIHAVGPRSEGYEVALGPFDWACGSFRFERGEPRVDPTITTPNAAIVSAGRQRAAEAAEARLGVASLAFVAHLAPEAPGGAQQINLSLDEWRFLTLVDGRRDLRRLAPQLGLDEIGMQRMAHRLRKAGLIELLDPRLSMIRMVAMPTSQDLRPPSDPMAALMDDLALDMLCGSGRDRQAPARAEVLTAGDQTAVVQVTGRPDLADRLLLSDALMARLRLQRNAIVHLRLMDDPS
jgi:hypothetical protein